MKKPFRPSESIADKMRDDMDPSTERIREVIVLVSEHVAGLLERDVAWLPCFVHMKIDGSLKVYAMPDVEQRLDDVVSVRGSDLRILEALAITDLDIEIRALFLSHRPDVWGRISLESLLKNKIGPSGPINRKNSSENSPSDDGVASGPILGDIEKGMNDE